jgi:rfaE bifunctional protein kinase chain/domain
MDYYIFKDLLEKIKKVKPKILVVGDIMLDQYIMGTVNRISPEAPVPILNYHKEKIVLGGAGNVLSNLLNLGADAEIATVVGDDLDGKHLSRLLNEQKSNNLIFYSENINTTKKTRFLSGANQLLRLDKDSIGYKHEDFNEIKKKVVASLKRYDGIIISDYNKGVCEESFIISLIEEAKKNKIPIFVDPKGKNWKKYASATCVTPNINEIKNELNMSIVTDIDFENAAKKIKTLYNLKSCLITRGADGMTYYSENNKIHQKVGRKEVFDVSGAGDSVISCLAVALCSGISVQDSLSLSAFVSSEVVSHIGTTPFDINMFSNE